MLKENLVGKKFNKLVVIEEADPRISTKRTFTRWKCKCECGNETIVGTAQLKNGHTKSCGCLQKEKVSKLNFKDLIGEKFGRLTVIKISSRIKNKIYWECICDCGNSYIALGESLKSGRIKSCWCLHNEIVSRKGEEHHNYKGKPETKTSAQQRKCSELKEWRISIYKEYNYTCQCCGMSSGELKKDFLGLNAHHIECWENNPDLRFDINNGILLCELCHKTFHKKYGFGFNTRVQLNEFLKK